MSKTPEEMARNYCEPILSDEYAKAIGREDWIGTKCVWVGEGHEMYKAFLAGYKAAQEHAHAALEEAEARIQKLQDQLADADKVINSLNNSNGWISVEDRLPSIDRTVVVAVLFKAKDEQYCIFENNWQKFVDVHEFYVAKLVVELNQSIKWRFTEEKVDLSSRITHWMPLPEPPKEEE